MQTYRIYVPIETTKCGCNYIKFSLTFNKDVKHWATSSPKNKGYQVTATPVKKGHTSESYTAFNGFYEIILAYERQSKKREYEAKKLLKELIATKYKKYFEAKNIRYIKS